MDLEMESWTKASARMSRIQRRWQIPMRAGNSILGYKLNFNRG
jgi:hypothetical protein